MPDAACTGRVPGAACDDGLFCTTGTTCSNQLQCTGGSTSVCMAPHPSCNEAADRCVCTSSTDCGMGGTCLNGACAWTVDLQAYDDAYESADGIVTQGGSSILMTNSGDHAGLRFSSAGIPRNAVIASATLEIYVDSGTDDRAEERWCCQDSGSAPPPSNANFDLSSRSCTTANTLWAAPSLDVGWRTSPSLVGTLQELVNRANWTTTSPIFLLGRREGNFARSLWFRTREHSSNAAFAPVLHVTYTMQP